ncbi:MAG: hypothetical protein JWM19_5520 [Actinomycetia bacterium]|nr:hypothetical protein [Actinomycetes bacterium]
MSQGDWINPARGPDLGKRGLAGVPQMKHSHNSVGFVNDA